MSEDQLNEIVKGILGDLKEASDKLEDLSKNLQDKSQKLMKLFYGDKKFGIFDEPETFWEALDDLYEDIGYAHDTVLTIEDKRKTLFLEMNKGATSEKQNPSSSPVVVMTQPLQQAPGFWASRGQVAQAKAQVKIAGLQTQRDEIPHIVTSEEAIDILDYGKQLIPEFNRVHIYFQQCLDHLHFFNDDNTKSFFYGELRQHLFKLTGIIRAFCRTSSEQHKRLLLDVKKAMAKGMTEVVVAQWVGSSGTRISEIYKALRQTSGPEHAGR